MPIQEGHTFKVVRTLPRRGELYAVTRRSDGVTEIRRANANFRRDKRRVFVPDEQPQDAA